MTKVPLPPSLSSLLFSFSLFGEPDLDSLVIADCDDHLWVAGVDGGAIDDVLVSQSGQLAAVLSVPDVA